MSYVLAFIAGLLGFTVVTVSLPMGAAALLESSAIVLAIIAGHLTARSL